MSTTTKAQPTKTTSAQTGATTTTTTAPQQQVNNKQKATQGQQETQSRNNGPRRDNKQQQNGESQYQNGDRHHNGGSRRYNDNDNRDSRNSSRRNNSGDDRRGPRRSQDYSESRTLYISRVNVHELEGHNLSEHYKQQRVGYLVSLFEPFGKVESTETHLDTDKNYILITFADHESALKAYDHLRDYTKKNDAVDALISKLQSKGLPTSLAPNPKFSVQWSNSKAPATKKQTFATVTQQAGPKNVIANAQAQTPVKQEKPEAQANTQAQAQTQAQPQQNGQAKKAEKKKQPQQQAQPQVQTQVQVPTQQPTVGSEDLIREAEKAKLKDELAYYTEHAHHLVHELGAEKERCASRDINIAKLKAEHARVQAETERIQKKLTHETDWKKAAEQRVIALTEELEHFQQEHQRVNLLLEAFTKN